MKKFFVTLIIILCSINLVYANDTELLNTISEIGSLIAIDEKYDEALVKCNEALKKYPDSADLYSWRATVLNEKGKQLEAIKDIDKAIELDPEELSFHITRGNCMADLGNISGAIDEYDYVIKKDPNNSSAYSMRAIMKMQKGEYDSASADLDKANKLLDIEMKNMAESQSK